MNKDDLRSILSAEYNADKWRAVLREVFGARSLQKRSRPVALPANNLADAAFELGSFETSDNRLVGLYQVDLKDNVRIGQNRVGLRSLLRNIYKYDVDAALVVFVQNDKWRLSLISEIRVLDPVTGQATDQKTEPKRFTYLLGVGETVRTAADRLQPLSEQDFTLEKLIDAFSVEKLTKAFFKRYKELFGEFCEHLTASKQYRQLFLGSAQQPKDGWKDPAAKPIRDFAKILLGRLVFLQFLQKKGWMGVPAGETAWENGDARFLKNLFERTRDKDHFHSGALRKLFFETLNRKRTDDLVDRTLGENIRVPYLNGGLFDTDISTGNAVDFPPELFADLLDFFEQYNFTIDEDDPYDREVGIDPEMLGHIFENLLEENREKGAFYTPKEIVHYMCQESLIEYLATHSPEGDRPAIETLVRDNQVAKNFTGIAKATEINRLLRDVKICDPAIGSGAFPMGLLKEIFECRRLIYPYLKTNETFDPARIKKEIIQNNIYGVDIDNGAVEIARLRFWLALVVDEIEPAPLPNLDYKIMQGNSLLERFEDVDLSNLVSADADDNVMVSEQLAFDEGLAFPVQVTIFDKADKEQLYDLITKYFDTDEWEKQHHEHLDKTSLKRQINDIVEGKIHAHILQSKRELQHKIREYERKYGITANTDLSRLNRTTRDFKAYQKDKDRLAKLDETEAKLIALQYTEGKPYFLWRLWFKDVFDTGGFDIVIANPPYIRQENLRSMKSAFEEAYVVYNTKADIYVYFYELSFRLLKKGGASCFITNNTWIRGHFATRLRTFLSEQTQIAAILDLRDQLRFGTAIVETSICVFRKQLGAESHSIMFLEDLPGADTKKLGVLQSTLNPVSWTFENPVTLALKEKVETEGRPLKDWDVHISMGVRTGLNEAYILTADIANSLISRDSKSQDLIAPILRGRDIGRYNHRPPERWAIIARFGSSSDIIENYPGIYEHLNQFKEALQNRGQCRYGGKGNGAMHHWLELDNCPTEAYFQEFKKPKIIWIVLSDEAKFAYDDSGLLINNAAFMITGAQLKYLLGVLNSKVSRWYFEMICPSSGMGTTKWEKVYVERIPIPRNPGNAENRIVNLVDEILEQRRVDKEAGTRHLEREIDDAVFEAFHLTEEEIALVENHFLKVSV